MRVTHGADVDRHEPTTDRRVCGRDRRIRPCIEERHVARVGQRARWLFYSTPSTHVWEDEMGDPQMIPPGEGGEQGDPLMPFLFSLGQHSVLDAVISRLQEGERVFAFLDDLHVLCDPGRAAEVYSILEKNCGGTPEHKSTRAKRRFAPAGWEDHEAGACMMDPNAIVEAW